MVKPASILIHKKIEELWTPVAAHEKRNKKDTDNT
jgi:hypothetical protein